MTNRIKSKEVQLKSYSLTRLRMLIEIDKNGSMTKHELTKIFKCKYKSQDNILARLFKDGSLRRRFVLSNNNKRIYSYSLTIDGSYELNRAFRYATGKEYNCESYR